jgi:tetratricopeptide (TPR) repeat protein
VEDNHNGLAIVANNLALIDLKQKNIREAHKEAEEAFRQEALATNLRDSDYSALYILKGAVADADGDPRGAIASYEKAINL